MQPKVKKVACNPGLGQDVEQALGVALDPLRQTVPILAIDRRGKSLDLKIILDIDGHGADRGRAPIAGPQRAGERQRRGLCRRGIAGGALQRLGERAHGRSPWK